MGIFFDGVLFLVVLKENQRHAIICGAQDKQCMDGGCSNVLPSCWETLMKTEQGARTTIHCSPKGQQESVETVVDLTTCSNKSLPHLLFVGAGGRRREPK